MIKRNPIAAYYEQNKENKFCQGQREKSKNTVKIRTGLF